jgi:cation diffusion facilitator family transporter
VRGRSNQAEAVSRRMPRHLKPASGLQRIFGPMAERQPESPIGVLGALAANAAIAVAKLIAAAISGSSAVLAEGIHSLADTGNEILLLFGLRRSRRPPDQRHPYGHGKELYFWGLLVAMVLFGLGGGMSIYEGLEHLRHPTTRGSTTASYVTLGMAVIFESISLGIGLRELRRRRPDLPLLRAAFAVKDPTVYMVVGEDIAAIAGLIVALLGLLLSELTGIWAFDAAASIVIGCIVAAVALVLARETRNVLTGESGDPALVDSIRRIATADRDVTKVGPPLTMRLGPDDLLLNLDVEFHRELTGDALRDAVTRLESAIRKAHPEIRRIFLEATLLARCESSRT